MDWFLYDNGLRHERVKCWRNIQRALELLRALVLNHSYHKYYVWF